MWKLAWPTMVQNLVAGLQGVIDHVLVGQLLGYTWGGLVENWHESAYTSFGDGHGVWEAGGGSTLPFQRP